MNVKDGLKGLVGSLVIGFRKSGAGEYLAPTESEIYSRFFRVEAGKSSAEDEYDALLSVKFWGAHTSDNLEEAYWKVREQIIGEGMTIGRSYAYNEHNAAEGPCATIDLEIFYEDNQMPLEKIRMLIENVFVNLRFAALNNMACEERHLG